jgi:hypothetical protein
MERSDKPSLAAASQPATSLHRLARVAAAALVLSLLIGGAVMFELREARIVATPLPRTPPVDTSFRRVQTKVAQAEPTPVPPPPLDPSPSQAVDKLAARPEPMAQGSTHGARAERTRSDRTPALSDSARADLDEAERAVDRGDLASALRLARSSLREASSERAYLLMARAYCGQHDVGMVQAMLRNLSSAGRKVVKKQCQSDGVTLP